MNFKLWRAGIKTLFFDRSRESPNVLSPNMHAYSSGTISTAVLHTQSTLTYLESSKSRHTGAELMTDDLARRDVSDGEKSKTPDSISWIFRICVESGRCHALTAIVNFDIGFTQIACEGYNLQAPHHGTGFPSTMLSAERRALD